MTDPGPGFALALLVIAALYAAVGQAGATGYLAAMGALGFDPAVMKPAALALNIVVAAIAALVFRRAGQVSWRTFYPFAVLGAPFSLLGGMVQLPARLYYPAVGAILVLAAAQMLRAALRPRAADGPPPVEPPFWPALAAGAAVGFVSGTTGTGGGVFLAPLILAMNWVGIRRAAAVTAIFNLVNSVAALAGSYAALGRLPAELPLWLLAVAAGGAAGATIGARLLPERWLRLLLAAILLASGLRMLWPRA
ncbi:sulfite exporter TauE/SafE family protein [Amaricoccus sp.]|uniref:sulfite exporter TauE/SafE family protein n=1 Tax=Amaricoccus sp. TaxID=1872485 RepID=UPI001B5B7A0C|nr:sulfite exporter TauE/SafE family protein [Amaricoccus sp.]MBP7003304.1 sulfite exporter TauE/SafE family protein [Amaricoccus sp.]